MTQDEIDGASLFDALLTAYARANIFSTGAARVAFALVEKRVHEQPARHAMLTFLTTAMEDEG
jgi:hypothetical protein